MDEQTPAFQRIQIELDLCKVSFASCLLPKYNEVYIQALPFSVCA